MTDISARLAGVFLYDSRGMIDATSNVQNQLKIHRDFAEDQLNDLIAGRLYLDSPLKAPTTSPTVEPM